MTRAGVLLLSEQGLKARDVAEWVRVSTVTVVSSRRTFVQGGGHAALHAKPE